MKSVKLSLAIPAIAAILATTQAHAWSKVVECNNGELVMDQEWDSNMNRSNYQLVLRGQPLAYFLKSDAVDPKQVNDKGEFVVPISEYDSEFLAFTHHSTASNGMSVYRNYRVSRRAGDVTIRATVGNRFLGEAEKANWRFHDCR